MKNTPQKAKTQRYKKINVFILGVLFLVYLTLFAFGCDESSKTPDDVFNVGDIYNPKVQSGDPRTTAFQIIQWGLADDNPAVRVSTIEVVATTRQIRLMPKVQRLLMDRLVPVRFAAALAVGDLEYSLAAKSVMPLLKDENENVIVAAAYAMGKLGFPEYFEVLHKALDSNNQTVRANAALLLGKSGDKSALPLLYQTLRRKDSHDKVVYQSAESIAMLGDEQIYPKLWTMLISAYADVRLMGIRAMGALKTAKARDALIRMLGDDVVEVRLAAAEQLGTFRDTTGEPEVLNVFKKNLTAGLNEQATVRIYVLTAMAIGRIGTPSLVEFLPRLMQHESKFVRIAAARAVFQCSMKR